MPDLIYLVHNNTMGLARLVRTFRLHWATKLSNGMDSNLLPPFSGMDTSPPAATRDGKSENDSGISKRQLEMKIQQIASKSVRAPSTKSTWCVHDSILRQYNIDPARLVPLLPPTPKSESGSEKRPSPDAPLSTPGSKKSVKRKAPTPAVTVKAFFEQIAKSPTSALADTLSRKRLKLEDSPAATQNKSALPVHVDSTSTPPEKRRCLERKAPETTKSNPCPDVVIIDKLSDVMSSPMALDVPGNNPTISKADIPPVSPPQGIQQSSQANEVMVTDSKSEPTPPAKLSCMKENLSHCSNSALPVSATQQTGSVGVKSVSTSQVRPAVLEKVTLASTSCLHACTNQQQQQQQQQQLASGPGEQHPRINWRALILNSNSISVTAEIH